MNIRNSLPTVLGLAIGLTAIAPASGQSLHVQVFQVGNTSPVYYQYRVVNNSGKTISRIIIGRGDYYRGSPELATAPLNWNFNTEVNPGSVTQPSGWTGTVATTEGSSFLELHWRSNAANSSLASGQALYGLNVALPALDNTYRSGHWTALFSDGSDVSGPLETVASAFIPGDTNSDGVVDCSDVAVINNSLGKKAGQTGFDPRADANGDGVVDIRDQAFVSQRLPVGTRCQ
jgi:hypothetical protein